MNKEIKLPFIIILFNFSILLLTEKSYQSIVPDLNEKNKNNNYVSNVKIIEKIIDKESKNEIKFVGEQEEEKDQVPIKTSEFNNNIDDKIIIANEIKEIQ
ncbi:MAG: hypothetical protein R3321_05505 [Nitrososphaeraceae archaeon]|nr:hypothetical protein [Nitrososphaeraceae archaeon]